MVDIALAADDPDGGASPHRGRRCELWSQSGFLVQHWKAMVWAAETELYAGDGARACEILDRDRRALKRSFLLHVQYLRAATAFVRARAPRRVRTSATPGARRAPPGGAATRARARSRSRCRGRRRSRRSSSAIGRERRRGTGRPRSQRSEIAIAPGLRSRTCRSSPGWLGIASASRSAAPDGARRVREAEEAFRAQGVEVPARFVRMMLPGRWGTDAPSE